MITKMVKLRIYGPRNLLPEVTELLQNLGILHIDTPPLETRFGFRPVEEEEEKAKQLVELETLLDRTKKTLLLLPPPPPESFPPDPSLVSVDPAELGPSEFLSAISSEVEKLHAHQKEVQEQITLLGKYEKVIKALAPLMEEVPLSPHLDTVGITLEQQNIEVLDLIDQALDRFTGGDYQIFTTELDRETTVAVLVFGRSHSRIIRNLLLERDLNEIQLPAEIADLSLKEALQDIHLRLEYLPKDLRGAQSALENFSHRWYATLTHLQEKLLNKIQQIITTRRFLCSKYSFMVGGWVPRRKVKHLRRRLREGFGGRVELEVDEKVERVEAPVHIRNPALVRPFEVFTRLLPLPVYGTVDPAPFFAFFFPIFFGLILGDIGYGIVILFFSLFLRRRTVKGTAWRDLASVFLICSLFTIFFGVFFGEFFSTLGEHIHLLRYLGRPVTTAAGEVEYHPLLYNRVEAMVTFLQLAVAIGAAHVFLGLILGIVNALRTRRYQLFLVKAGTFTALFSLILLLAAWAQLVPSTLLWPSAGMLAGSLIGTTLLEGLIAPIEIFSSLGNILSYARIMAIGLASVILGLVANRLGALPENLLVGILIATALHAVNLVFGIFSPTIHSMRLHFVEFFGKFYEPGGKAYQPFKRLGGT